MLGPQMEDVSNYQHAIFDRFTDGITFSDLCEKYQIDDSKLRRLYHRWCKNLPKTQPKRPSDIHMELQSPGRPVLFNREEEKLIADAVTHYAANMTPLTRERVCDLAAHVASLLPPERRRKIKFRAGRPSKRWLDGFLRRNTTLEARPVQTTEAKRVEEVNQKNVAEHISSLDAVPTESGTVTISIESGGHLTADACIEAVLRRNRERALQKAEALRKEQNKLKKAKALAESYNETPAEIRHLLELSPFRQVIRRKLDASRLRRRYRAKLRAAHKNRLARD